MIEQFTESEIQAFYDIFFRYHSALWPMIIITYILGLLIIFLTIRRLEHSSQIISVILAFLWIWVGIFFFLIYGYRVNPTLYLVSGILYCIQSVLFLFYGVYKNSFSFRIEKNGYAIVGMSMIVYALIIYPLIEIFRGNKIKV